MDKTIIEIPTELLQAANLSPEEARIELAIRLYQLHKLNDEQAGDLAGDSKVIKDLAWGNAQTGYFELNDFLSWASHDLKTPLNAIIGFSRVLMKGMDGPINDIQSADLATVHNGGQRMLVLISNLVDMARLNNGEIALTREECDIVNIIKTAAGKWQTQNPAKSLETDINITTPTFNADTSRLQQIITNMLSYAAIRITEGTLSFSAKDEDNQLKFVIQSSGQKSRDKFEMDSAMLGFISTSLIKMHGGEINTIEEIDNGMLIVFSLPR